MRFNLRTIAFLMLLAGLSLGIFAARVLRAVDPTETGEFAVPKPEARVQAYVELLRRDHHLDEAQTRRAGEVIRAYDRAVRQKIYDLRVEHQAEFRALYAAAWARIDEIVAETRDGS